MQEEERVVLEMWHSTLKLVQGFDQGLGTEAGANARGGSRA